MPTTPNLGLPYPSLTAAPNVPADIQALAVALDSEPAKKNVTQSHSIAVTLNSSGNQAIYYPLPFATPPIVVAWNGDYANGGGEVFSSFGRPLVDHFNVHSTAASAVTRRVDWIAVGDLA